MAQGLKQPMVGTVPFQSALSNSVRTGWALIQTWLQWFKAVRAGVNASALVMAVVTGTGTGSLGPTIFTLPVLSTGLYRVSFYLQVTTPASVSSSLTPKLKATNNAINTTQTGAAMTSNAAATPSSSSFVQHIDSSTVLSWELDYVSVGVTTMAYLYAISVEQLPTPTSTV